jgi:hypothetical protein
MLKGFFYRRTTENNPFRTDINIRFEINSKESILAKVANLSQEGIQFLLPRGKVILVPDERILLILNSPEHGEFKIPSDVYYFCNITDSDNNQLVCYGSKFYELSVSTWEVIQEFCGNQLPGVTFLSYTVNAKTTEKPINPTMISPETATATVLNEVSLTKIPAAVFMPFTPLPPVIPVEASEVIPVLTPAINHEENLNLKTDHMKTTASTPKFPIETAVDSIQTPAPTLPVSSITKELSVTPDPNIIQVATAAPGTDPVIKEEPPAKSHPSPIQVLAASLATPPIPHTQPKAQSMSQEMIDRLIEKLQVETNDQQVDYTQSVLGTSTPAHNEMPDHHNVTTSGLNTPHKSVLDSVKSSEPFSEQTFTADNPEPVLTNIPFTIPQNTASTSFEPVNFQFGNAKQPNTTTSEPSRSEVTSTAATTPFNPFVSFNFQSDDTKQPDTINDERDRSEVTSTAATAPFDPFAPFNFQSGQVAQYDTKIGDPALSEATPETQSASFKDPKKTPTPLTASLGGTSLVDLMSSLDSTINKNVSSLTNKPVAPTGAIPNEPILSAKTIGNTISNRSLEELKKIELPYSGKTTSPSTPDPKKKSVVPVSANIPTSPISKYSGVTSNTTLPQEKPANQAVKTPPLGSSIIPNASGISLDQKAIDKLVNSLIQDMPADESAPADRLNLTEPVPQPHSGITDKNGADSKINPTVPPETVLPFSNNTTKVLNMIGAAPYNNRVMDQKSIDVIVKTLTEGEPHHPVTPNPKPEQPSLVNSIPIKSFGMMEPKRTLDQKAIDQVVQALTQNFSVSKNTGMPGSDTVTPFINAKTIPNNKLTDSPEKERTTAFSLASLSATLQLEQGEVIHAAVEQIYVGGIMVSIEKELPINSSLKLNLFGNSIKITGVMGTCTNCEATPDDKTGFLAEIFFKNMNNTHMEQFRSLIAKLEIKH